MKQFDLVESRLESGESLDEFALPKVYVQKAFASRLPGLPREPRSFLEVELAPALEVLGHPAGARLEQ